MSVDDRRLSYLPLAHVAERVFIEHGWLRTGDKVRINANGCLHITGRVKDLFKTSKDKCVAPAPIENRLMLHPAVEASVVTGASLRQPLALMLLSVDAVKLASDLAERERLNSEFAQHLDAINASLDPYEQLSCLVLLMTPCNVDNNLITPTFKI